MLARRLLGRGGSGSGFTPTPRAVSTLTSATDGGHTFFGGPRGLYLPAVNKTAMGYVDGSGNVCVRAYDQASRTVGAEVILAAAFEVDDHVNPSFHHRADGKILTAYAHHSPLSTTVNTRLSTNANDVSTWDAATDLDATLQATSYDYPQFFYLSAESKLYWFWRSIPSGNQYNLVYSTSTDDGNTWAAALTLCTNSTKTFRQYWQITSNGVNRIDFAITDGSPNTDTTHLRHFYYDGTWRKTDGTSMGAIPFTHTNLTAVHTSSNSWVWDIALGSDGHPRILYPTFPTEFTDHRYNEAVWNGSAWSSSELCTAGGGIDATGVYSGGFCYDQTNPTIVYASRVVSGQWEMWKYVSGVGTALTTGSGSKNIRPVVPRNHGAGLDAYWMFGSYTGYTVWSTGLKGYG